MGEKLHYLKNPRHDKKAINNTRVLTRPLATEADLQQVSLTQSPLALMKTRNIYEPLLNQPTQFVFAPSSLGAGRLCWRVQAPVP